MTYAVASVIVSRGAPLPERDAYNNVVYGPDVRTPAPCQYTHTATSEDTDDRDQRSRTYLAQWPGAYYAHLQACDSVELPIVGTLYLQGPPLYHPGGITLGSYVQAVLGHTTG